MDIPGTFHGRISQSHRDRTEFQTACVGIGVKIIPEKFELVENLEFFGGQFLGDARFHHFEDFLVGTRDEIEHHEIHAGSEAGGGQEGAAVVYRIEVAADIPEVRDPFRIPSIEDYLDGQVRAVHVQAAGEGTPGYQNEEIVLRVLQDDEMRNAAEELFG
mmetsp:Transcript_4376/g.5187  ORF Transcript_4376/g.5187 Transcript_4376/m.5187 type:complete len:160 (+) Transcript_4376:6186-6665(+)